MRISNLLTVLLAAAFAVAAGSAFAVTDGRLDGDDHPGVILILMEVDGEPAFRCSGTLLSPTVVLTAGHCAGEPGEFSGMRVFTESDVQAGIGTTNNYPYAGPNAVEAVDWASHPQYTSAQFFVHDVGVVVLEAPGVVLPASEYGVLPTVNMLDGVKRRRNVTFTAVGYGLQESFPDPAMFLATNTRTRFAANPWLLQINAPGFTGDYSMLLSNNHSSGGTCFGDSGGPNFLGSGNSESKIVAGVTSFGINGNCAGTGGVFRIDRQNVLDFVNSYLD
jgi:secreted trypsin-like serine protease